VIPKRRWHLTEREALAHAREVGGKVGHSTIGARPDRSKGFHTDWLESGPGTPGVEWVPPHLSDVPTPPVGS